MIYKYINRRTIEMIVVCGLFYYLYTKLEEVSNNQEYLESRLAKVVEHLNKKTLETVVKDSNVNSDYPEVYKEKVESSENKSKSSVKTEEDKMEKKDTVEEAVSDEEYLYIHSDDNILENHDFTDSMEQYDEPYKAPESETVMITGDNHITKGSCCNAILHSGKRKGFVCGKAAIDGYCKLHKNYTPKPSDMERYKKIVLDEQDEQEE